ncbi:erythromycin esterase family protein [Panacibacter ginsenosidivorans]|uniref:Erythromycin esterase family protein n=1 Tax=Panacibacter ginsenosidivorans TaxID=1813871 RepID=A0A5B8V506_9BACT|nr:erythromycin esterase family protein [Panacibacter ginsenosidivorans]QEC65801.1 erythromycin esterase family protein [Panacibacter ginsenosidivorans]
MRRYFTKEVLFDEHAAISTIKQKAHPLQSKVDLQPLFNRIGDSRIVMLGEASHGTHEYYTWRAHITKRLIEEKGFNFIAVEGDWPDCYRLNRFIKGYDADNKSAFKVLRAFNRWPTWMWANWEIIALADWLRQYNIGLAANKKSGFYGLDVYSLWESMESIMRYLQKTDKAALKVAEEAYHCFEPYKKDEGQAYARALQFVPELCENEVVHLLKEIQRKLPSYNTDHENVFNAEQNALVTVNAEKYYRAMIKGGPHSWNVRDRHMADTLERLLTFHGPNSKVIVWEHNTHIGDARATDMIDEGMFNIGELARMQHHEKGVVLVGFGSYKGSVMAGRSWGAPMHSIQMPEAEKGSWEYLLHKAGAANKLLMMDDFMTDVFMENHIGHRAIGVVYNPRYEQYGNYVPTILPMRYDAFIYLDETKALHPLHIEPDGAQMPETYPFGV